MGQAYARPSHDQLERELAEFEAQFTESLDYKFNNNSIKLIGYKKIKIPDHELSEFEDHYFNNHAEWKKIKSVFYDSGSTILRVYFPVEAALIEHNGKVFEANHLGELELEEISGDCAVLGRKQTDYVTGVEGNVIKDGIIYLANRNRPHHQLGKVYVYDFGDKVILGHDHHHSKRDGKVSCMNNHGGRINCSDRFNIHNGRCPHRRDVCVNYNGYWTNCQKSGSKIRNFPGSDCYSALARGHCWNEIM